MGIVGNAVINIYSIIILIVIYVQSVEKSKKKTIQKSIFLLMIDANIAMLVSDIFSRFDGMDRVFYPYINHVGNMLVFSLNLIPSSLWLLYVYSQTDRDKRMSFKKMSKVLVGVNLISLMLTLSSEITGLYYYIDSDNIYHRGPLFILPVILMLVIIGIAYYFIIRSRKKLERKHFNSLLMFAILPVSGIFLQIYFYGMSLMLNCLALSMLMLYLNIQNKNMEIDYLTGVYNRGKFEEYLKEKIRSSNNNKTFSAVMIDLNDFKEINDNFGHNVGDDALLTASKIFQSCIRPDDFIARLGGDEFGIILDTSDTKVVENVVDSISKKLSEYNKREIKPYRLAAGVGYSVYDRTLQMAPDEFKNTIDSLMYENKYIQKHPL